MEVPFSFFLSGPAFIFILFYFLFIVAIRHDFEAHA